MVIEGDPYEAAGVNSRAELAHLELEWQRRRREQALDEGATLIDPESVWFAFDTRLGRDVTVEPHVVFGPGVEIADGADHPRLQPYRRRDHRREGEHRPVRAHPPRHAARRATPRSAISSSSRRPRSPRAPRSTICPTSATHRSARRPTSARARSPAITTASASTGTVIGAGAFIGSNTALVAPVTRRRRRDRRRGLGHHPRRRARQPRARAQRAEGHRRLGARFRERMTRKAAE